MKLAGDFLTFVEGSRMHCPAHIAVLKSYAAELSVDSSLEDVVCDILCLPMAKNVAFSWHRRNMSHHDFGTRM